MGREVELKLEVTPAAARKFAASRWLPHVATAPARKEKLVSVYYDTDDFDLRKRRAALRVRKVGDLHIQTVKAEDRGAGGPLGRIELEREVRGDGPDLQSVKKRDLGGLNLRKFEGAIKPIFETSITRTAIPVRFNGSQLEIAIDVGQVKTGRKRLSIYEIEIELKDGDPAAVVEAGVQIAEQVDAAYGAASKAERGYALCEGKLADAAEAADIVLHCEMTASDAFKVIGLSCLRHFAANRPAVLAGDPEGIHQMRIGLRRLRAAISVFKGMLRDPETVALKQELKWLTGELGHARDMDVLVGDTLVRLESQTPDKEAIGPLKKELAARRAACFERARMAVESERYRKLLLTTAFWLTAGKWVKKEDDLISLRRQEEIEKLIRQELERRRHNIVKDVEKLKKLDDRQRHKLRIAAKKLRYATEFFQSLFDEKSTKSRRKALVEVLKELQSSLGQLNDIRVHAELAKRFAESETPTQRKAPEAFAMGLIAGEEGARTDKLLSRAAKAGGRIAGIKPFWKG